MSPTSYRAAPPRTASVRWSLRGVKPTLNLIALTAMSRVTGKPYFTYVLWSERGRRFYIGISEDPDYRIGQHNSPEGKHWTVRYRPWKLVYREAHCDFKAARRRENELKRQKGGKGFFAKTGLDPSLF